MLDLAAHALLTHNPHIVGLIQSYRYYSLEHSYEEGAYGGYMSGGLMNNESDELCGVNFKV